MPLARQQKWKPKKIVRSKLRFQALEEFKEELLKRNVRILPKTAGCDLALTIDSNNAQNCKCIKLYSGAGKHFSLRKAHLSKPNCILVYIWDADLSPEYYFAKPSEALAFLGTQALKTKSWQEQGYYKWSSASQLPKSRREQFVQQFGDRWEWFVEQLDLKS